MSTPFNFGQIYIIRNSIIMERSQQTGIQSSRQKGSLKIRVSWVFRFFFLSGLRLPTKIIRLLGKIYEKGGIFRLIMVLVKEYGFDPEIYQTVARYGKKILASREMKQNRSFTASS